MTGWEGQDHLMRTQTMPRTQEARTDAAKQKIRTAALELFALKGFDATTLADISLRAGYSRALAQYHYPEKTQLALELLELRLRRDLNADSLKCAPATPAAEAFALLEAHLRSTSEHYRLLHGRDQRNLLVRGEMALQQAALMSGEPEIRQRVNALTSALVSRVAHILEICREQGFIRADVDVQAASIVYVHAIWGLASALFANPNAENQIAGAFGFLGATLNDLRRAAR
jgi:AcrR family transcriptional regulator